ncbi:MAG TPA: hypothetical protein PL098_00075 [Brevundimonas diminuta]|nr:hypothetical protein [Brevundimonas diminuta]HRL23300.1 hypothetical protein [Brevundimonas diminuta]
MRKHLLHTAASTVFRNLGLGTDPLAPAQAPAPLRSRKKGQAYRHCYNEQRVGDKLTYFHATKGRRTRRVPA